MENKDEQLRHLIELAVASGKKRKSTQTGYLHYCYGLNDQEAHLPIPLVENFLYALALLRTRTIEHVNEAKVMLSGLLHFQNRSDGELGCGNFPIYIHDYPVCKDRFIGVNVGLPVYWILKQFGQFLGQELKGRLEKSLQHIVAHALKAHQEKEAHYSTSVKIASLSAAAGEILGNQELAATGKAMLETLSRVRDDVSWYCPAGIGEILSGLVLVFPSLKESPWQAFWDHVQATWHRGTASYIGPALREWQQGEEPQVTVYDLFLGYLSGAFSARALKEAPIHLEAALIPHLEDQIAGDAGKRLLRGTIKGTPWTLYDGVDFAYCAIDKGAMEINPIYEKGFYPLRVVWGDLRRTHTFVCQGGAAKEITFATDEHALDMEFVLGPLTDPEDREKCREAAFFFDAADPIEFRVSGEKSSTFLLEDNLLIRSGSLKFAMAFELKEGEGKFLGHRMLGNRPSQQAAKGAARYNAYDWEVFLRTVDRPGPCRLGIHLEIVEEK